MSDSHEPSYYEIALTNRQVVIAFVILLVCLIAAFFSGVWVGRESGVRAAEQMAGNTPPPEEEEKEGQNLEELEFFESEQKAASPDPAPPPPVPEPEPAAEDEGSTLAEDVGSEEAVAPEEAEPAGEETEQLSRRERRRRQREEEARQAQERRQQQEQPAAPRPRPEPAAPVPAEPARAAGQIVIQVFSSPERDQAERIRADLARGGQRAFLSPVEVGGRTMYRVRIGPFSSRDDAQKVAEQVRRGYKLDTWVTE